MRVLSIDDLHNVNFKELKNLHQLVEGWKDNNWISSDEGEKLVQTLKSLNIKHHSEKDFEYRFCELFSFDKDDKFFPQTIDRNHVGGHFVGVEFNSGVTLFSESMEMGVIMLVDPETINKDNARDVILAVNKVIQGINDPAAMKTEMQYSKLNDELDQTTDTAKKIKI